MSDLQRYFSSGVGNAQPESADAPSTAEPRVDLAAALASPDVIAVAADAPNSERLAPHMPTDTQDDVRTTLLSPQFAQVNFHVMSCQATCR